MIQEPGGRKAHGTKTDWRDNWMRHKQLQRRDKEGERDKTGWGEHTWTDMSGCGNTRRGTCGHRRETQNNDPTKTYTEVEGARHRNTNTDDKTDSHRRHDDKGTKGT